MKRLLIRTIIVLILPVMIFAGDPSRKGTTGAEQLLIPVGARGIATGGSFLANVTGLEAIYYNPAGLDLGYTSEAMFSYMSYIADINVSYFAIGTQFGDLGSFAFSFKTLDFGDIPITTVENPDGTGAEYSPSYITAGISYSKVITDRVSFGVNAKVVNESIINTSATGFALDFGVQYRFDGNLSIAAAVNNIGTNMIYSGSDLQSSTEIPGSNPGGLPGVFQAVAEEFQIPSYFELSTSYRFAFNEQNNLNLATRFRNNNVAEDQLAFGAEYNFMQAFFIRGGYDMMLQNNGEQIYGPTFGAGISYPFTQGMGISFDYAYRTVQEFPDPNHIFTVKLFFE